MAAPVRLFRLSCALPLSSRGVCSSQGYTGVRCLTTSVLSATGTTATEGRHSWTLVCCPPCPPLVQSIRGTSFFNKLSADQLWKGVTSVSNAGKKQGRGKGMGKRKIKNLNRGQVIGVGKANMLWPGLNAPVLRGRELQQQQLLPEDKERDAKLIKLRDSQGKFRSLKVDPLERGWSGTKLGGRSIGPPDPVGEDTFEGFDTKCLEMKIVTCMTAVFGRKRQYSIFVVCGNGNGLAGFALRKATTAKDAIRKAKNKAGQRLLYIHRYNNHTVLHDFFTRYGNTKIYVKKMPEGYGLVCHRVIRTICQAVGIKDLHAKVEGSMNTQNMTKAFFLGLINQKTHQQLANEKNLHLVEFREENHNFPRVVASPEDNIVRTKDQIPKEEEIDFTRYLMDGKVQLKRKKFPPFYTKLYSYQIYLKTYAKTRNQDKVKLDMLVQDGEVRSFYTDQYPECRPQVKAKVHMKEEDLDAA